MKHLLITTILLITFYLGKTQQIFQDANGKANIFIGNSSNGWITFNSSDKSGSIGYNRSRKDGYDFIKLRASLIYGGDVKIGIKNGLGALVSDGNFKPSITLSSNFGLFTDNFLDLAPKTQNPEKASMVFASLYLRPSFSYTQYSYIDTPFAGIPKLSKINKKEGGILLNLNVQINKAKRIDAVSAKEHFIFIGLQTGFTRANNYSDLDEITISTVIINSGNTSTNKSEIGKFGIYKGFNVIPLNFDFGITPRMFKHNYFGLNTYFRSTFLKPKNDCKAGIGIYLADEKHPSNITGGFAWQFNDIFNALHKNNQTTFEKSSIFFYVGYSIR